MNAFMTQQENAKTLAMLLGLDEEQALPLLDKNFQITWYETDTAGSNLGKDVVRMLQRTFNKVGDLTFPSSEPELELLINDAVAVTNAKRQLHCYINASGLAVMTAPAPTSAPKEVHPALIHLASSFAAAYVAGEMLGLPVRANNTQPYLLDFEELFGQDLSYFSQKVEIGKCHLIGAGAVGDAFIFALQLLRVSGEIVIVDPKPVKEGILNRCLCYTEADVGQPKAVQLANKASAFFQDVAFSSFEGTLRDYQATHREPINRMIVGVDSRGARRLLQEEMPKEVFDASTTGVSEVVFHHNDQPTDLACLACIYTKTDGEYTHDQHVADQLNVSVEDVQSRFITEEAAYKILEKYPEKTKTSLVGQAYDSMFKALCAVGQLRTAEDKQVLAPFAFVSQLAGTVLAIEFFRRIGGFADDSEPFNYWRLSPWARPLRELQALRLAKSDCEVCSDSDFVALNQQLWNGGPAVSCSHAAMKTSPAI